MTTQLNQVLSSSMCGYVKAIGYREPSGTCVVNFFVQLLAVVNFLFSCWQCLREYSVFGYWTRQSHSVLRAVEVPFILFAVNSKFFCF